MCPLTPYKAGGLAGHARGNCLVWPGAAQGIVIGYFTFLHVGTNSIIFVNNCFIVKPSQVQAPDMKSVKKMRDNLGSSEKNIMMREDQRKIS